jgi:hypothetical protein
MGFVPMELSFHHTAVSQTNRGESLHLTPPSTAIKPNKSPPIPDASTGRDGLDGSQRADDVERHSD